MFGMEESQPLPTPDVELMYRPPGEEEHRNITKVLDDLILRVEKQGERILDLEEQIEQLLLLID